MSLYDALWIKECGPGMGVLLFVVWLVVGNCSGEKEVTPDQSQVSAHRGQAVVWHAGHHHRLRRP
jgi:hypothetical protein